MEKIAIISDIHGNIPALDAVLQDIHSRGVKRIICLGDLVGKGPSSAEAVDQIRAVCESVVQGNWDLGVTYPQDQPEGLWHQQQLGEERLAYLEKLPFSVDIQLSGRLIRLFHASAKSVFHRVKRKAPKEERLAMFHNTELTGTSPDGRTPDVVGYGDIHIPYLIAMKSSSAMRDSSQASAGLTLFNTGSVGAPYDGVPQACYCILEGQAENAGQAGFSIQFVRVPYDIERAVQTAYEVEMPGNKRYELELTTGLVHKS